jgi:hypothetical protein
MSKKNYTQTVKGRGLHTTDRNWEIYQLVEQKKLSLNAIAYLIADKYGINSKTKRPLTGERIRAIHIAVQKKLEGGDK